MTGRSCLRSSTRRVQSPNCSTESLRLKLAARIQALDGWGAYGQCVENTFDIFAKVEGYPGMQNAFSKQQISSSIRIVSLCAYSSTFRLMKIPLCFQQVHLAIIQSFKRSAPSFTVILAAASA